MGVGSVGGCPLIHKVVSLISAETSLNLGTISLDFLAGIILDMLWELFNF